MSSRCPGARSSTSSTPLRSPTPCADRRWRPAPGNTDPLARAALDPDAWLARTTAWRTLEDPRRCRDRSRGGGLRPAHRRVVYRRTARCPRTRRSARSCRSCALALVAEQQTERFARARRTRCRPATGAGSTALVPGNDQPMGDFGATLHVSDAGRALLSALSLPSGIYNVCSDGERVLTERFTRAAGWHPHGVAVVLSHGGGPDATSRGHRAWCDLLRSLHRPGAPLLLPNAWDVATASAVVAAGFPVVATTSGGVAATLGYEDDEVRPADEMLAAAARIARGVEVPVTVDAEAGYGMAARRAGRGAAERRRRRLQPRGHRPRRREPPRFRPARGVAQGDSPGRVDGGLPARDQRPGRRLPRSVPRRRRPEPRKLVPEALRRATAYLEAGADCVYPIGLWEATRCADSCRKSAAR